MWILYQHSRPISGTLINGSGQKLIKAGSWRIRPFFNTGAYFSPSDFSWVKEVLPTLITLCQVEQLMKITEKISRKQSCVMSNSEEEDTEPCVKRIIDTPFPDHFRMPQMELIDPQLERSTGDVPETVIVAKAYDLEASSLTSIKQQQGETLKKYIQRQAVTHGQLFVLEQQGAINPPQGVGNPQLPGIQAPNAQVLLGTQTAPTTIVVVAPNPKNPYPLGIALPALDNHVATISVKEQIVSTIKANSDVLAWSHVDMTGISSKVIFYALNINPNVEPVWRKRRPLDQARLEMVMPFCLKNVGAIYQRMVNKMFKNVIGKNMEVYIDDMLVKSKTSESHYQDLEKAFAIIREYEMKSNPKKCTFRVSSWKFLGFIVSSRGIEANSKKIKAFVDMSSTKKRKDVQKLTGRIATFSTFVSKSTDKCIPLFNILRGNNKFEWTTECEIAFQQLKKHLVKAPILSKPVDGELLFLYLAVSDHALSATLVGEEGKVQLPVYYICKRLLGAESRYSMLEKLSYCLLVASRKLRP
uniref:Uncharacterized protein n=1 Tax=Cannabis sativa TaxID=3483 RepID=A0A803NJJ9_CANSA